ATVRASSSAACCRTSAPTRRTSCRGSEACPCAGRSSADLKTTSTHNASLSSSAQYKKTETDLAIIVTPRIVRPTRPGDLVKSPLDNTLPAKDIDFCLMGKNEVTPADARLAVAHQRPFVGHILDVRREGIANVVSVKN